MRMRDIINIVETNGAPDEEVDEQTPSQPTLLNKVMSGISASGTVKSDVSHNQTASSAGQLNPPTAGIRG